MSKKTQYELVQDIHIRVVKIEEHIKEQNNKVFNNKEEIKTIYKQIIPITTWSKLLTITLTLLAGGCGFMLEFILSHGGV